MKRASWIIWGVLVLGVAGGMGSRVFAEWSRLKGIDGDIREQKTLIEKAWEETRALREEIDQAKDETAATADSSNVDRAGTVMKAARNIAKAQEIVERDRLTAQRRLRSLEDGRTGASDALKRWLLGLAVTEAFLVGAMLVVLRYPRRPDLPKAR